jgi:acetate kinase
MDKILVINSGSTTVKFQLFQMDDSQCDVLAQGMVERIGNTGSKLVVKKDKEHDFSLELPVKDHKDAIKAILDFLTKQVLHNLSELSAVGHRMGHGGEYFDRSVVIDDDVMQKIYDTVPLLPLHGPAFVHGLEAVTELLPDILQVATFDSAYHQSLSKEAYTYAIPPEYYANDRIRRYGFHGTSHNYAALKAAEILGYEGKFICCHMGGGVSVTAIKDGKSVDTTMGYTPFAGVMMATRSGDMDPYIPLHIMKTQHKTVDELNQMFNKESGLYGLTGGHSDMRDIMQEAENGNKDCAFAIDAFVYNILKAIGSYVAVLGGVDALIFTAGIGENNSLIRQKLCEKLSYLGIELDTNANAKRPAPLEITTPQSKVKVLVIPAAEELMIAEETYDLLKEQTEQMAI